MEDHPDAEALSNALATHRSSGFGFPLVKNRASLLIFFLMRDIGLCLFTERFGVGFGLFLCLVDLFANLSNAGACWLYVDDKALAIG
jgi:hypothetical protein